MGPVAQLVFKTSAVVQPTARSVRLRRRSVEPSVSSAGPNLSVWACWIPAPRRIVALVSMGIRLRLGVLAALCLSLVSVGVEKAASVPPFHGTFVVTRTGFIVADLCSFPVRIDRPQGQTVRVTDFIDYARPGPDATEQFVNFVNVYVNPANGKSVAAATTGTHFFSGWVDTPEGGYSFLMTTTVRETLLDPQLVTFAGTLTVRLTFSASDELVDATTLKRAGIDRSVETICAALT